MKYFGLILFGVLSLGACGRSKSDSAASRASSEVTSANGGLRAGSVASSTTHAACPRTGLWARCSVETRLDQSGFVVRPVKGDAPKRPGFSVVPAVYTLGRSRLEVFVYSSPQAAARDASGIDTLTASPRGAPGTWRMPPTYVRSANLIAVFLTDSPVKGERFSLALTAGPPQP
jgi:hypothetical protein